MPRLSRFQNTAEISGISLRSTASFSMIDASVSSWCTVMSRARAAAMMSAVSRSRMRMIIRARISSGIMPFTN